jgi:hypothetical protein
MKFPSLYAACLLLALLVVFAGCSSSPSVPGTADPAQKTAAPVPGTTAHTYNESLLRLMLLPDEIPFAVMLEQTSNPKMNDPTIGKFGGIQGISRFSVNETVSSPSSVQLGQVIVEYPPGNATLAFAKFVKSNQDADQSRYKITWLADPQIGDKSCSLSITDSSSSGKTMVMIVFVKSGYMESVVMIASKPDVDALTRTAKLAAAKMS